MSMDMKAVALIDDDPLVCMALKNIINTDQSLTVAAVGNDGFEAVEIARRAGLDIILLDIHMNRMNGIEAIRSIREFTDTKILVLTVDDDDDAILKAVQAGADGFVSKDCEPKFLLDAIHHVLKGEPIIYPRLSENLLFKAIRMKPQGRDQDPLSTLTDREKEILLAISSGKSNREIAEELVISIQTVKSHVSNILKKLKVRDRTQAVLIALSKEKERNR